MPAAEVPGSLLHGVAGYGTLWPMSMSETPVSTYRNFIGGLNLFDGKVFTPGVAEAHQLPLHSPAELGV